jgi:LuxR family maltose regulon positive regulatory protein
MSYARKLDTLMPVTWAPEAKERDLRPYAGNLLTWWDARNAGPSSGAGETLTAREREVVLMISQGLSNKRIARDLEISPETVKSHVKRIFLKLSVGTRTEAVVRAALLGFL